MGIIEVLKKTCMEQVAERFMMEEKLLCSLTHLPIILIVLTGELVETHLGLELNMEEESDHPGSLDLQASTVEILEEAAGSNQKSNDLT
jgi:hypothetical protein